MKTALLISMGLLLVADVGHAATVAELLAGKQAVQCYLNSDKAGQVRCRHLNTGDDWAVYTQPSDTVELWVGGLNRDATKLVGMRGKQVVVMDIDGANPRPVSAGTTSGGHFWRDPSGNDWVVYLGELENKGQAGTTWRVRIDPQTNAPVDSTRKKIADQQYSAGLGGSGVYLAESYGKSFLYNLDTGTKSLHLNGVQNCVGSPHAGDKPWMMYERDTPHHDIVISEWNESANTARYIWQYNAGSKIVFSQWSSTDDRFATISERPSASSTTITLLLIKLQVDVSGSGNNTGTHQQAAMNLDHNYLGPVWIGTSFSAPVLAPPAAPAQLTANAASASRIDLRWQDRSDNESGFKVERKQGQGSYQQIATVAAGKTSYADATLDASTRYTYRLRAYNDRGNSGYSNEASATTADPPPEPPTAPDQLQASTASADSIDLAWRDRSDNEAGFEIERKQGTGSYQQLATVGDGETSYADTGLEASTRYSYRVRARNAVGNSGYSNEASATTADAPPEPVITITSPAGGETLQPGTTQQIQWTAVGITDVVILLSADQGESWETLAGSVDDTMDNWRDYAWVVPAIPCDRCIVRIKGYFGEVPTESQPFAIQAEPAGDASTPPLISEDASTPIVQGDAGASPLDSPLDSAGHTEAHGDHPLDSANALRGGCALVPATAPEWPSGGVLLVLCFVALCVRRKWG